MTKICDDIKVEIMTKILKKKNYVIILTFYPMIMTWYVVILTFYVIINGLSKEAFLMWRKWSCIIFIILLDSHLFYIFSFHFHLSFRKTNIKLCAFV